MMSSYIEKLNGLVGRITSGPYSPPRLFQVPTANYKPTNTIGGQIPKDAGYFSVRVNELFLKDGTSLWDTYDPMLVAVTEFLYDAKKVSIPFVISSELLKQ